MTHMTKRQAIAEVRAEANYLIYLAERKAAGWDKGAYRDDDTLRATPLRRDIRRAVARAFALSAQFAEG